jgi:soluble lytic murein transglycosylase
MKFTALRIILLLSLLLAACSRQAGAPFVPPPPADTPTPSSTPLPTATSTPTPIPTPVAGVRIESGDQALTDGDYDLALQEYQAALAQTDDPATQAAALLGIGRTRLSARNYPEAIDALSQVVENYSETPHVIQAYFFLGRAYDASEQYPEAAEAYQNYLNLRPGIAEAYVQDLRGGALFAAGEYPGAAEAFRLALASPSTLDRIFVQLKMARSIALAGDPDTALAFYADADLRTQDDYTHALIALRTGQIYQGQGQTTQALQAYRKAVENYPRAYEAYSALQALDAAGEAVDDLQRGLVDYFAGEYGAAMQAFDRYLQKSASAATPTSAPGEGIPTPLENVMDPATALYYYGLASRQQGGYQEAIQLWDKLIANYPDHRFWDDAWEQKAYTQWAYLEDYKAAVKTLLDFVDQVSAHPRAAEFLLDAALVAERDGNLKQAADLFEKVIDVYPNYEKAPRALFLAALSRYRSQDYQAALLAFLRYQGLAAALEDRAAAAFWIGKTQFASGDTETARATWQTASGIDPTGYYSERGRDLLEGRAPFEPPAGYDLAYDLGQERQRAEDWLRTTFKLPPDEDFSGLGSLASDPAILRGRELWELGLYDEARAEFEAVRQAVASDPALTYRLCNYLLEIGLYRPAIEAARQVLSLAYLDGAATLSAPAYFNHVRFGTYYSEMIMPLAKKYDLHPLFLFALVRQESLFEGFVSSTAGARGLMQVIPDTGADLAKNLGWPPDYQPEDLYRPLVSLTLGVDYLSRQRKAFEGDLYAALAAYNGGPGNALQWIKLASDDPDLFLEVIRYEETRNYIRGVYEQFGVYRMIYNRTP